MNATTFDPIEKFRIADTIQPARVAIDRMEDMDASERRAFRARTDAMIVVPRTDSDDVCIGIYDVFSASGSHYVVDLRERRCDCPDCQHNGAVCKHIRRVAIAVDETPLTAPDADATSYFDWLLDQIHVVTSEYSAFADRTSLDIDGAVEAVRTVDNQRPAPTA